MEDLLANSSRSIVLFGDSITQESFKREGWGTGLAELYLRKADVINRGLSGFNTRFSSAIVDKVFYPNSYPRLLFATVFLGANDASMKQDGPQNQHVPLDEYEANLIKIIAAIRRNRDIAPKIVVITPPPVDGIAWRDESRRKHNDVTIEANRDNEITALYAKRALKVAEQEGTLSINLHAEIMKNPNWKDLLRDGLHLNEQGNNVVLEALLKLIRKEMPQYSPEKLDMEYPDWKTVDQNDVGKTLVRSF
eukprot:TRINITY_DN9347_c0_g1_i1.p1 TRINITY_DN9347_c0_g1~~TRINITY_DN9347_c0_g1_i1.p1  ORF type:complete len:250 (+),score=39.04 TRINITY_DN9347_c0_g1_i1:169-918(+)